MKVDEVRRNPGADSDGAGEVFVSRFQAVLFIRHRMKQWCPGQKQESRNGIRTCFKELSIRMLDGQELFRTKRVLESSRSTDENGPPLCYCEILKEILNKAEISRIERKEGGNGLTVPLWTYLFPSLSSGL